MIARFLIIASATASLTDALFGSGRAEDEEPVQNGGPSSATLEQAKAITAFLRRFGQPHRHKCNPEAQS